MKFNLDEFRAFCKDLRIETKELGLVRLGEVWRGTQEYFIQEVARGLEEGCHYFVVLKGRQVMISTVCLALDLYWHFKYAGTSGTLITDSEENRQMFNTTMRMYIASMPKKWRYPVQTHNRTELVIGNRSRIAYQVVGTKKKERRSVGVGKAIMMMHATECSNWGDEGALADIESSLAESNPRRLYIFESTARGYNHFEEMWEAAKNAKSQRAIFIGWWRNDLYRKEKGSPEYDLYWDGTPTLAEEKWMREVKDLYDFDITPEQLAWWRWKFEESIRDEAKMFENYPPTEEYAFQMSGSKFFSSAKLGDRMRIARAETFDAYRISWGITMADTELVDARAEYAQLKIWQMPKPNGYYALGADPAYGSSEWADRFAISIYRCYADGLEQVAEFCDEDCDTTRFAWLVLYLAGCYNSGNALPNVMVNLEVNGPGMHVWTEMQSMRRMSGMDSGLDPRIAQVVFGMQNYLYRRQDSLTGGLNYHTKTTTMEKERFMSAFKDGFESGIIMVNSVECLEEMKKVQREEGEIGVPGRGKDDRVIASALATIAWTDFLRLQCAALGATKAKALRDAQNAPSTSTVERNVQKYLKHIGFERPNTVG